MTRSPKPTELIPALALCLLLAATPAAAGSGAPTAPLTGPSAAEPADVARNYLETHREALGLTKLDLAELEITDQITSSHNGVTHLYLRPRLDGIPVINRISHFNIAADGRILSFGNQLVPDLAAQASSRKASLAPAEALTRGAAHLRLATLKSSPRVLAASGGPTSKVEFSSPELSRGDIPAELAYYFVAPGDVRLTWQLLFDLHDGSFTGNTWISADDGSVVEDANLITFDTYNVYELPKESPSDGLRTIVANAADPTASPFGWHDTNGSAGAEFTDTRGNNVFAQEDFDANNVGGFRPDGGPALDFDFPLDLNMQPPAYISAAVTNLFYMNNIMHDVLYQYGFDEAAGNFQQNNYTGASGQGDAVRADAQDGSGFNNANFLTLADGTPPRMQMFQWKPPIDALVTVNAPPAIAGDYAAPTGNFGPQLDATGPVTGIVELVNDGGGPGTATDGCEPLIGFTAGNVAMIDRGECDFSQKVFRGQVAGAIAVIVANNQPGLLHMGDGAFAGAVNIPSVLVSQADATLIKNALANGVNVTLDLDPTAPVRRDSDLDNGIIAHEYGHGLSNRLTGGKSQILCLQHEEQAGEGWSDWLSLIFTALPSDTPTTARGIGTYVSFEPANGPGIRNFPYTTDVAVNPQTYGDIGSTNIPHGVGEIFASMLWEMYWRLVERDGFDPDLYAGTGGNNLALQLSIDGMKMQGCNPDFVDARDGILVADMANYNQANTCVIWKAFAKRGLGLSATAGNLLVGNETEAFDIPATCQGLVLSQPLPGTAGVENDFHVTGATAGAKTFVVGARQATSTTVNITGCGPVTFDVGPNLFRFGANDASQFGDAKITTKVQAGISGNTVHFQAFDLGSCTTSNVVSFAFP